MIPPASASLMNSDRCPELRVGVIVARKQAWIVELLERLHHRRFSILTVVMVRGTKSPSLLHRAIVSVRSRLRRRLLGIGRDAFASWDQTPPLADVQWIDEDVLAGESDRRFETAVRSLEALRLDVVIDLLPGRRSIVPTDAVSYGVWRPLLNSDPTIDGRLPRRPGGEVAVVLEVATSHEPHLITDRIAYPIEGSWPGRATNRAVWGAVSLVVRELYRLHMWREEQFRTGVYGSGASTSRQPARLELSDARDLASGETVPSVRQVAAGLKARMTRPRHEGRWCVGLRQPSPARSLLQDRSGFHVMAPPDGHFYADPFTVSVGGRSYVVFEDYRIEDRKAVISAAELDVQGRPGPVEVVLSRDTHLSYPYIFVDGHEIFMLPESRATSRVELLRAIVFPTTWERVAILLDGVRAVDPTLVRHAGRYWLFCAVETRAGATSDELHLYYADTITGPWMPHPLNPVVIDAGSARPAGTPFWSDGRLIRPGQNSWRRYGENIVLNRIETMTDTQYAETRIGVIAPDWAPGLIATHTVSVGGPWEALDGLRLGT